MTLPKDVQDLILDYAASMHLYELKERLHENLGDYFLYRLRQKLLDQLLGIFGPDVFTNVFGVFVETE